jgi:hypothetical protein
MMRPYFHGPDVPFALCRPVEDKPLIEFFQAFICVLATAVL